MDAIPRRKISNLVQVIFDFLCVTALLVIGFLIIFLNPTDLRIAYGVMVLIAVFGSGFKMVSQALSILLPVQDWTPKLIGWGKKVSSIAFSLFLAVYLWINFHFFLPDNSFFFVFGVIVALFQIVICFFKGNQWESEVPPTRFLLARNLPLFILLLLCFIASLVADYNGGLWNTPFGSLYGFFLAIAICFLPLAFFYRGSRRFPISLVLLGLCYLGIGIIGLLL